jgi:hypothetical protein
MAKNPNAPAPAFPWFRALGRAANAGAWSGAAAGGAAAVNGSRPLAIATAAAFAFAGTAAATYNGEVMKHRLDDPSPVLDGPTAMLFDTAGMIIGLMLFFLPALQLDHALHPDWELPGAFGYAALFLTGFLLPVLRGLLINLGVARAEDSDRVRPGM